MYLPVLAECRDEALSSDQRLMHERIGLMVEALKGDQSRSSDLFQYLWSMMCVRRGLLRVVREVPSRDGTQLILEEVATGNHRFVARPPQLEPELETLAVQALSRMLESRQHVRAV
jgi:hypothetical protein